MYSQRRQAKEEEDGSIRDERPRRGTFCREKDKRFYRDSTFQRQVNVGKRERERESTWIRRTGKWTWHARVLHAHDPILWETRDPGCSSNTLQSRLRARLQLEKEIQQRQSSVYMYIDSSAERGHTYSLYNWSSYNESSGSNDQSSFDSPADSNFSARFLYERKTILD